MNRNQMINKIRLYIPDITPKKYCDIWNFF